MKSRTSLAKKPQPQAVVDMLKPGVLALALPFGIKAELSVDYVRQMLVVSFDDAAPMELFAFAELGVSRFEREFRPRMIALISRAQK